MPTCNRLPETKGGPYQTPATMAPYCSRCDRYFVHYDALEQHRRDSSFHYTCDDCDKDFPSWIALEQHYVQSPRHNYCQRCTRHFSSHNGLNNHRNSIHHFCHEHGKYFDTFEGLRQHYIQSGDHYYCALCDELYDDEDEFLDHGDCQHYICRGCVRIFDSENDLMEHNSCAHYFCRPCNRFFTSASNLQNHLNSNMHAPRNVKCPGRGCGRAFVSVSALILHAESGTCPSGVTRAQVDAFVSRLDQQNIITNPALMIAGPDGTRQAPQDSEYWATERSWNGYAYECFLCNGEYNTLRALNMHLQSPRHRQRIYRCPQRSCGIEYGALSSLSQHVESGSCGVRANRQVQNVMDNLTRNLRMIAL